MLNVNIKTIVVIHIVIVLKTLKMKYSSKDIFIAEQLKQALFSKMMDEFSDLIHNSDEEDKLQILFKIPGKEETFHWFQFPSNENHYLTKEGAYEILNEMKHFDEKLSTCAQFIWFTDPLKKPSRTT